MEILKRLLKTLCITTFFIYVGYILFNQQIKLNELNDEIVALDRKCNEANLKTEALSSTKNSIQSKEYMEEVARERLGYVFPNEQIFVDASI